MVEYLPFKQDAYVSIANFPMILRKVSLENRKKSKFFNQNVTKNVTKNVLVSAPWVPYHRSKSKFYSACVLWRKFFLNVVLIVALMLFAGCGHIQMFKDWDKTDTTLMTTELGLMFVDYRQTIDLSKKYDDGYFEKYNACCLKSHPSRGRINTYFISSAFTKILVAGILKKNKESWLGIFGRESWLILNIGASTGCISRNFEIGLEVNF